MALSESDLLTRIGSRVRRARSESGLTIKELAASASLSPRFVSQLEAGQANIAVGRLAQIATALEISLAELVAEPEGARSIALVGLRGAGKSTIGPRLASHLGVEFVELDDRIEEAAGLTLVEIFALHGEAYYRRLEGQVLSALLSDGRPRVIALPGGIVGNTDAWALARRACRTVWLRARPDDHMRRVEQQGDRRPMANRPNAMAELRSILASREPMYAESEVSVDTSECTAAEVTKAILTAVQSR